LTPCFNSLDDGRLDYRFEITEEDENVAADQQQQQQESRISAVVHYNQPVLLIADPSSTVIL
jgi:hypothetical protein